MKILAGVIAAKEVYFFPPKKDGLYSPGYDIEDAVPKPGSLHQDNNRKWIFVNIDGKKSNDLLMRHSKRMIKIDPTRIALANTGVEWLLED